MTATDVNEIVHHRVARSTGATVTVERTGPGSWVEQDPGWTTICLSHGTLAAHDTRRMARDHAAAPEGWCGDCQSIAAGDRPRITTGLVR